MPLARNVLDAHVMGFGVTPQDDIGRRANSPLETLAGLTLRADESWSFGLAGGVGLLRGYGAPDLRVIATSAWRLPEGRSQRSQPTAAEAEEVEPVEVEPVAAPVAVQVVAPPSTRDSDADGVPDAEDQCPVLPGPVDLGGCLENIQYSPETGLLTWATPLHWRTRQAVLEPSTARCSRTSPTR